MYVWTYVCVYVEAQQVRPIEEYKTIFMKITKPLEKIWDI